MGIGVSFDRDLSMGASEGFSGTYQSHADPKWVGRQPCSKVIHPRDSCEKIRPKRRRGVAVRGSNKEVGRSDAN